MQHRRVRVFKLYVVEMYTAIFAQHSRCAYGAVGHRERVYARMGPQGRVGQSVCGTMGARLPTHTRQPYQQPKPRASQSSTRRWEPRC